MIYVASRIAGWSSLVARRAHNPKVDGSNPSPATNKFKHLARFELSAFFVWVHAGYMSTMIVLVFYSRARGLELSCTRFGTCFAG